MTAEILCPVCIARKRVQNPGKEYAQRMAGIGKCKCGRMAVLWELEQIPKEPERGG